MNINLNLRSDIPIYLQVIEQVRQQVASGDLKPGDQLPTVRALATDLMVNFNTIARAYRLLDQAGILSTQQGRGTYILNEPPPETTERLRAESLDALARRFFQEASRLGLTSEQTVKYIVEHASGQ